MSNVIWRYTVLPELECLADADKRIVYLVVMHPGTLRERVAQLLLCIAGAIPLFIALSLLLMFRPSLAVSVPIMAVGVGGLVLLSNTLLLNLWVRPRIEKSIQHLIHIGNTLSDERMRFGDRAR